MGFKWFKDEQGTSLAQQTRAYETASGKNGKISSLAI